MFERFTEEARRIVVVAQEEARDARADQIGPVHLLLGATVVGGPGAAALRAAGADETAMRAAVRSLPGDGLDADALAALGIDLDSVRDRVEAAFGAGALTPGRRRPRGHMRFADGAKRALEQALRAALRRGDRSITSAHVLLGVLAVGDPGVAEVLQRLGIAAADLRRHAEGDADAA
jgi:ATP-dependent Clp protease ATP-binding subunit ClpA